METNANKIKSVADVVASVFHTLDGKIMTFFSARLIRVLAVLAVFLGIILLHYLGVISVNIKPFSTTGSVYVDSPEIYTRERLVNDRYDQDFWLREQLRRLDETNSLSTTEIVEQVSGGVSKGASSAVNQQSPQEIKNQEKPHAMPFDQDFRIRSAIRDAVRQLILENILDDRHDLMGNSVYGLKFDTTVIPGDYTQKRAFVRVQLKVNEPFTIDSDRLKPPPSDINKKEILSHQYAYYVDSDPFKPDGVLYGAKQTYGNWLENIQDRLNLYLTNKFKSDDFGLKCGNALHRSESEVDKIIEQAIRETVQVVLGYIDKRDMFTPEGNKGVTAIMLPQPWVQYMSLSYRHTADKEVCHVPPVIYVKDKWNEVTVFGDQDAYKLKAEANVPGEDPSTTFIKYGDTNKKRILAFGITPSAQNFDRLLNQIYENWEYFSPSYAPSDALIDLKKCDQKKLSEGCPLLIPSGLFNFIERVQKSDFYSYAVFPKNEVAGVFSTSSVNLDMASQLQDAPWLSFGQGRRESQLESVLVGFGDGGNGIQKDSHQAGKIPLNQEEIQFGWVLSGSGNMTPTQKTELALVSVPAWATRLKLTIKTGWLDRNANENTEKEFEIEVPVPPDFQALDSLILKGNKFQRRPKILNDLMEANLKVLACENAKILIPGTRLWRSATVTLGAQKANRIMVLPNMEGIIAEFAPVEIPHRSKDDVLKAKLQVWTSEGVDTAEKDVEIQLPSKDGSCPKVERKH